jgi:hypothetical protein
VRSRLTAAALGPQLRLSWADSLWTVDLHAEAVAAWLTAGGAGFTTDLSEGAFDPGLGAGARFPWFGGGGLVPWLEVGAVAWPRAQTAFATPGSASVTLPRLEATLAIGVSFGRK